MCTVLAKLRNLVIATITPIIAKTGLTKKTIYKEKKSKQVKKVKWGSSENSQIRTAKQNW